MNLHTNKFRGVIFATTVALAAALTGCGTASDNTAPEPTTEVTVEWTDNFLERAADSVREAANTAEPTTTVEEAKDVTTPGHLSDKARSKVEKLMKDYAGKYAKAVLEVTAASGDPTPPDNTTEEVVANAFKAGPDGWPLNENETALGMIMFSPTFAKYDLTWPDFVNDTKTYFLAIQHEAKGFAEVAPES